MACSNARLTSRYSGVPPVSGIGLKIGELRTISHIDDLFDVRHVDRPT
jgi:hypothetical protein